MRNIKEYHKQSILPYQTKPAWNPEKPGKSIIRYGLELEIEGVTSNNRFPVLEAPSKYIPQRYMYKRDGSLDETGAELVTSPLRLTTIQTKFPGLCDELQDLGCNSFDSGRCGLHLHVSNFDCRKLLKKTSVLNLACACYNFMADNRDYVLRFSSRAKDQLNSYASLNYGPTNTYTRYKAVNLCNNTMEFRIFRGTLLAKRLIASAEFVDALIRINAQRLETDSIAREEAELWSCFTWSNLIDYADKHSKRYGYLSEYLRKAAN